MPLVESGSKTSTWRLFDDKDLSVGDIIELRQFGKGTPFANAKIIFVDEKPFGEFTPEDKEGHESFTSEEQMYDTYSGYYNRPVDSATIVKIIRFELLK